MNTEYFTIEKTASFTYKEKGSSFIAFCYPVQDLDECKKILNDVKKEHAKATHVCFAYRIGQDGTQFRSTDAGEPSGTAGKQILGQIDSKQLTNTLVVVVRYFGGTLLGVPGLIQAYRSAASMVLQLVPVVKKMVEELFTIHFNFNQMNEVMSVLKQHQVRVVNREFQLFCKWVIAVPIQKTDALQSKLGDVLKTDSVLERLSD
ncbi:MAG: YigZ family protein [Bacteroidetes bacterium]|nr:MAG: YigZ family protein [Bacteroidota bacterium]